MTAPDISQMEHPLGLGRLGYAGPLLDVHTRHWEAGALTDRDERVIEETPVAIAYNNIPHVVMMATPVHLADFALGFSLTEELVRSPADVLDVQEVRYSGGIEMHVKVAPECEEVIRGRNRRLTGRTGCGICGADSVQAVLKTLHQVRDGGTISGQAIHTALAGLAGRQELNALAGAVHAAGWATTDGTVRVTREDVGRHNALDKLIGALVKEGVDPASGFVVVTSRASFEMVQKTTVFGAPLLAAISGPTALAIRVAEQSGLTLVGFARRGAHTAYTHARRVTA